MRKKVCTGLLHELKEMLGEEATNDIIYGFLNATDRELQEIKESAEMILMPSVTK